MAKQCSVQQMGFGHECAATIHAIRQEKKSNGETLTMNDVAEIIDEVDRKRGTIRKAGHRSIHRRRADALLELYGRLLSPVQRAHASEQFEAICEQRGWN